MARHRYRSLTLAAVGFLGLDGVLFLWLAHAVGRPGFLWAGAGCLVLAAVVVLAAREQQRRLAAIAQQREELRRAAEELRKLVGRQ
ncbi:MAG: hypothetical protein WBC97_10575 [Gemmatimonadales bacterium]